MILWYYNKIPIELITLFYYTTGGKDAGDSDANKYTLSVGKGNTTSTYLRSKQPYLYNAFDGFEDWERNKRGALHLYGIIKCATGCNPLTFKGYGCFCGFMGDGEPVDGIDMWDLTQEKNNTYYIILYYIILY